MSNMQANQRNPGKPSPLVRRLAKAAAEVRERMSGYSEAQRQAVEQRAMEKLHLNRAPAPTACRA